MSINSPEAHSYLSDKIIRGAEEYACGIDNLASIMALDMPTVTDVSEAAIQRISAMAHPENRQDTTDNLRRLPADVQIRSRRLAHNALVASQASALLEHGRNPDAPPDSRRQAITLAHSILNRRSLK